MAAVPQSREEVVENIAAIGALKAQIDARKARADEALRRIARKLDDATAAPAAELKQLETGVQAWCEAHRSALTGNGKVKYHDFTTGKVNWRQRPPAVSLRKVEAVIESCKALGLTAFIRIKEEVNRDAMLADPQKAAGVTGVTIKSAGEDFIIEPAELQTARKGAI